MNSVVDFSPDPPGLTGILVFPICQLIDSIHLLFLAEFDGIRNNGSGNVIENICGDLVGADISQCRPCFKMF